MRRVRRLTLTGLVLLGALAFGVASADAARPQVLESAPFSQPGVFSNPTGVAVNQETGNVYVANGGAGTIDVFGASGGSPSGGVPAEITGLGNVSSYEAEGVAVDNSCSLHTPVLTESTTPKCSEFDPSNGDVYLANVATSAVQKLALNSSHEYEVIQDFPFNEVTGVAVDNQGNVYVADFYAQTISEFNAKGEAAGTIEQHTITYPYYIAVGAPGVVYVGGYPAGEAVAGVAKIEVNSKDEVQHEEILAPKGGAGAVDAAGDVFIDEGADIAVYSPAGSKSEEFGSRFFGVSQGVAVNDTSGDVYVTNRAEANLVVFGPSVTPGPAPVASTGAPTAETTTTATVTGEVNPEGTATRYWFEYGPTEAYGSSTTHEPAGAGTAAVPVTASLTSLTPDTIYHYRLVARNSFGDVVDGADETVTIAPAPPTVDSESGSGATSTTVTLEAQVNPNKQETHSYLQYSTSATVNGGGSLSTPIQVPPGAPGTDLGEGYGDQPVTPPALTGLTAGTTYYYQAVATNATGTSYGSVKEFATVPAPFTDTPSPIGTTTATLNGHLTLNPNVATKYAFVYHLGSVCAVEGEISTPTEEAGIGTATEKETSAVEKLQPNAEYTVCFLTSNEFSAVAQQGPPVHFTTGPAPPEFIAGSETAAAIASATGPTEGVGALVNPNNEATACRFEYGTEPLLVTGTASVPCSQVTLNGFEETGETTSAHIENLNAGETYYYRVVVENAQSKGTPTDGEIEHFTAAVAPTVNTGAALDPARTSIVLDGTVNPNGVATSYHFVYIDEAGYQAALAGDAEEKANPYINGASTTPQKACTAAELTANPGSCDEGTTPVEVEELIKGGLLPGTTYHYALVASTVTGSISGVDKTFTTAAPTPPLVTTGAASGVALSTATISGSVGTQGLDVNYAFEVSTEAGNPGPPSGGGSIGAGTSEAAVSLALQGLQPGTTYYYRLLATSTDGTSYGVLQSFTTPGFPAQLVQPATPVLVGTPAVAFPTGSQGNTGTTTTTKTLTRAQKLSKALKACAKKPKGKRAACRKQAHKKYPATKKKSKSSKKKG